jgi:hypothetical protein
MSEAKEWQIDRDHVEIGQKLVASFMDVMLGADRVCQTQIDFRRQYEVAAIAVANTLKRLDESCPRR